MPLSEHLETRLMNRSLPRNIELYRNLAAFGESIHVLLEIVDPGLAVVTRHALIWPWHVVLSRTSEQVSLISLRARSTARLLILRSLGARKTIRDAKGETGVIALSNRQIPCERGRNHLSHIQSSIELSPFS